MARQKVIGVVGGVERTARLLSDAAGRRGVTLEMHAGHMSGSGDRDLQTLIGRADLVVITTDVNSHAAVRRARELARQFVRKTVLVKRLGPSRLGALIDEFVLVDELPAESEVFCSGAPDVPRANVPMRFAS